jgi:solute carrier family 25 (adenine nucleotide translocator) protein 4/5/6/31
MASDVGINGNYKLREFNGMIDCFKKTMAVDGLRGFYRGYMMSIGGIVAYRALYFGLYDTGRTLFFSN